MFIIIICCIVRYTVATCSNRIHNIRLLRIHSLLVSFSHTLDVLFIVIRLTFHSVRHPSPSSPHLLSYWSSYSTILASLLLQCLFVSNDVQTVAKAICNMIFDSRGRCVYTKLVCIHFTSAELLAHDFECILTSSKASQLSRFTSFSV